jgi:hypothetical protein
MGLRDERMVADGEGRKGVVGKRMEKRLMRRVWRMG